MTMISERQYARSLDDACLIAKLASEFRGRDTVVLDLTKITPIFDFFVISTGNSSRQMHALADEVRTSMKKRGSPPIGVEGYEQSNWILADFGHVVLHVFLPETRALYDLERLWGDAVAIDWKAKLGILEAPAGSADSE